MQPSTVLHNLIQCRKLESSMITEESIEFKDLVCFKSTKGRNIVIFVTTVERGILKRDVSFILSYVHKNTMKPCHYILIGNTISKTSRTIIDTHHIEFVPIGLLTFNHMHHTLVPTCTIVPKENVQDVCQMYRTPISQWPWILVTDPQVCLLGAREGDMVYNHSEFIYRVVVRP